MLVVVLNHQNKIVMLKNQSRITSARPINKFKPRKARSRTISTLALVAFNKSQKTLLRLSWMIWTTKRRKKLVKWKEEIILLPANKTQFSTSKSIRIVLNSVKSHSKVMPSHLMLQHH